MKAKHCSMAALCCLALIMIGCKQQEVRMSHPVKVTVMKVTPVTLSIEQDFSGTVEEASGSTLSFPVAGTVQQIRVVTGQRVVKGELIAVLDEETLRSAYEAASASLVQAEDAYQRMKQLHDAGSLPEIQWVEVQSKLKQAESAEAISKKNLADGKLYAPFSGVISEKNVEVGHNVTPGQPVVRLVTINQVKVCVSVPENEISQINVGQPVNVSVSALNGKTFSGKIVEKGVVAHPLSRSYEVKAIIENRSGELMPGMICTMGIDNGDTNNVIILPAPVIQTDEQNRTFVWVNEGGKARKRMLQTGMLTKDGVVILYGISAGDEVIVEGQQKVSEGMDVTTNNDCHERE